MRESGFVSLFWFMKIVMKGRAMRSIALIFFICVFIKCNYAMVPDVITLPLPEGDESLNIKETEDKIMNTPLKQLILDQLKIAPGYIIARTKVTSGGKNWVNYYDAANLNRDLFRQKRPGGSYFNPVWDIYLFPETYYLPKDKKEPTIRKNFDSWDQITYFVAKEPSQIKLAYLGSMADLMPSSDVMSQSRLHQMRKWFNALYNENEAVRKQAQQQLGLQFSPVSVSGPSIDDLLDQLDRLFDVYKMQPTGVNYQAFKKFWQDHVEQFTAEEDAVEKNTLIDAIQEHIQTGAVPKAIQDIIEKKKKTLTQWVERFNNAQTGEAKERILLTIEGIVGDMQFVSTQMRKELFKNYISVLKAYQNDKNNIPALKKEIDELYRRANTSQNSNEVREILNDTHQKEDRIAEMPKKINEFSKKVGVKLESWSLYPPLEAGMLAEFQQLLQQIAPGYAQQIQQKLEQEIGKAKKPPVMQRRPAVQPLEQALQNLSGALNRLKAQMVSR